MTFSPSIVRAVLSPTSALFDPCKSVNSRRKASSRYRFLTFAGILAMILFATGLALAQADPFVGIWKLNVAKSKFAPGAERKSETRIVESSPTGMKVSVDRNNADGSNQQYNYTTNFDGKPHPITGTAPYGADSIAVTLGTSNNLVFKLMKNDKTVGSGTSEVSADGKTLTLKSEGTDANGKAVRSVSVYDKQ